MSAPPWGHKPPKVAEAYDYWSSPPPQPSERAVYWVRRWREGSWKPNRRLLQECTDCRAGMLGIWMWEARFAFYLIDVVGESRRPVEVEIAQATEYRQGPLGPLMKYSKEPLGPYWALLEPATRPTGEWADDVVSRIAVAVREMGA